jgi:hypothetical protein
MSISLLFPMVRNTALTKTLGCFLVILCLPLLVFSIIGYLFTTRPYVGHIDREYARDVTILQGKSFYIWYDLIPSPIILNQTLNILFEVTDNEVIDFYLMSDSQWQNWNNGSAATGMVEAHVTESENILFLPPTDGKYYLVLDNTLYNSSKLTHFQSIWTATLRMVDYSVAFNWLTISFISLGLLITGNLLSRNVIGLGLRKALGLTYPKEVKQLRGAEVVKIRNEQNSKLFWIAFGLLTIAVFIAIMMSVIRNLPFATENFPELFAAFIDVHIRLFLYLFSTIAFLSILVLFIMTVLNFLQDINLLYFVKIKKLPWNAELSARSFYIFLRMLISVESVLYYIAGLILCVAGYFLVQFRFPLFITGIFVFSIPASRSGFQSYRRACKELNLKWKRELKHDLPFALNDVVIMTWTIPLFLLVLRATSPLVLDIAGFFTIDSLPLQRFQEYFYSELDPRRNLIEGINVLTSDFILFSSLFFLLVVILAYYFLPAMSKKLKIERKVKMLIAPLIVAFLTFAMSEAYAIMIGPAYIGREGWSLFISLIAFGTAYLAEKAFEEAVK